MTTLDFNSVPSDPFSMMGGGSNTERLRIKNVIEAMEWYGVPRKYLFKIEDLLNKSNIPKVVRCLEELELLVSSRVKDYFVAYQFSTKNDNLSIFCCK